MSVASQIYIVPLEFENRALLDNLIFALEQIFNLPVKLLPIKFPLKDGFSPGQDQLNSNWLLIQLLEQAPDDCCKILGVTNYDLYIPILTYLFGEAELGGQTAVFSIHRFRDELYGLPPDNRKLESRMLKEATHELGHTFGLHHCQNYNCVMHSSSYIEEFDFKSDSFCDGCRSKLDAQ